MIGSDAIRVAVVDVSFDKLAALPSVVEGPMRVGLPGDDDDSGPARLVVYHPDYQVSVELTADQRAELAADIAD